MNLQAEKSATLNHLSRRPIAVIAGKPVVDFILAVALGAKRPPEHEQHGYNAENNGNRWPNPAAHDDQLLQCWLVSRLPRPGRAAINDGKDYDAFS